MCRKEMVLDREDLLKVLRNLEVVVVSLDRVGSYSSDLSKETQNELLADFIDRWEVFDKLAESRGILSEYFGRALGDDDMDELERALQDVEYWNP